MGYTFTILFACCVVIYHLVSGEFRRVCYHTNWSGTRIVPNFRFRVIDIDTSLCTHLVYAFAKIDVESQRLTFTETGDDNGQIGPERSGNYYDFNNLKETAPHLKTMLSVGGQTLSKQFTSIVAVEAYRLMFAHNCVIFLRDRGFDGLDVDWEYPPKPMRDLFTELLKDLRNAFEEDARTTGKPRLILSIATAPGSQNIDTSYNIREMVKYVDFVNVMAYDYFGGWSRVTGFGSPLYPRASNPQFNKELNQNWTIHRYIEGGAPHEKLVMGLRGAGVSFTLNGTETYDVGTPVKGPGKKGSLLKIDGVMAYPEVCKDMLDRGARSRKDEEQISNYAFLGNQWVGYDDPETIRTKVKYANALGLGGVMFWSFDLDDYMGKYCGQGLYPLMTAMKEASQETVQDTTSKETSNKSETTEVPSTSLGTSSLVGKTETTEHLTEDKIKNRDGFEIYYLNSSCIFLYNYYVLVFCITLFVSHIIINL